VLLLGPDKEDLVYRFRTRASAVGFASPELRVLGAMRGIRSGELFTIVVEREGSGYCIGVNGTKACGVGFTEGLAWALFLYGQGFPPWTHPGLNVLWMAGLALPVGYWARPRRENCLAVALLGAAVLLMPRVTGLSQTAPWEVAGALAGLLGGVLINLRTAA
jgi:hypothetical protein